MNTDEDPAAELLRDIAHAAIAAALFAVLAAVIGIPAGWLAAVLYP